MGGDHDGPGLARHGPLKLYDHLEVGAALPVGASAAHGLADVDAALGGSLGLRGQLAHLALTIGPLGAPPAQVDGGGEGRSRGALAW